MCCGWSLRVIYRCTSISAVLQEYFNFIKVMLNSCFECYGSVKYVIHVSSSYKLRVLQVHCSLGESFLSTCWRSDTFVRGVLQMCHKLVKNMLMACLECFRCNTCVLYSHLEFVEGLSRVLRVYYSLVTSLQRILRRRITKVLRLCW